MNKKTQHHVGLRQNIRNLPFLAWSFVSFLKATTLGLTIFLSILSCNQGQLSGGSQKKEKTTKSASALNSAEEEAANEERVADQPELVAGAFLTCAIVDTNRTKFPEDDNKETLGCALVRDSKKVNLSQYRTDLDFHAKGGQKKINSPSEEGPLFSKWHRYGQLPKDEIATAEARFKVTTQDGTGRAQLFKFELARAKSQKSAVPKKEVKNESVPGVTFNVYKVFNPQDGLGSLGEIMYPGSFCENGVVRPEAISPKGFGDVEGFLFDAKIRDVAPSPDGKPVLAGVAFRTWSETDVELNPIAKRCVIEGAGCLFITSVAPNIYIFDKETIAKQGITLEELKKQTMASLCFE